MCGIVGYVGSKDCAPILVEGLRRLEYRGYDSAGLPVHTGRGVGIVRAVGKLTNPANAHPHVAGRVAVVHNGIIENHVALRKELEASGVHFSSDTDTEIVAHLVNEAMKGGEKRLAAAVRAALLRVTGAYAIAVVSGDSPDEIVVAKHDSPLVLGNGEGEMFAASDIPALLAHTRDVV